MATDRIMPLDLNDFELRWIPSTDQYDLYYRDLLIGFVTSKDESGQRSLRGLSQDWLSRLGNPEFLKWAGSVVRAAEDAQKLAKIEQERAEVTNYYDLITGAA